MSNTNSALRDTLRPEYIAGDTIPAPAAEQAICPTCLDDLLAEEPGPHCSYCAEALRHVGEQDARECDELAKLTARADRDCGGCGGYGYRYHFTSAEDPGRMVPCTCSEGA